MCIDLSLNLSRLMSRGSTALLVLASFLRLLRFFVLVCLVHTRCVFCLCVLLCSRISGVSWLCCSSSCLVFYVLSLVSCIGLGGWSTVPLFGLRLIHSTRCHVGMSEPFSVFWVISSFFAVHFVFYFHFFSSSSSLLSLLL